MTEIEQMYQNAGVLKECLSPCYINKTWRKLHDCPNCNKRTDYPPFTAEKQLEIIKILVHKSIFSITIASNNEYHVFGFAKTGDFKISFEEALASYINSLWQDIQEEDKIKIKRILEK